MAQSLKALLIGLNQQQYPKVAQVLEACSVSVGARYPDARSAIDGTRFEPNQVLTVHQGRPLWVRLVVSRRRGAGASFGALIGNFCLSFNTGAKRSPRSAIRFNAASGVKSGAFALRTSSHVTGIDTNGVLRFARNE